MKPNPVQYLCMASSNNFVAFYFWMFFVALFRFFLFFPELNFIIIAFCISKRFFSAAIFLISIRSSIKITYVAKLLKMKGEYIVDITSFCIIIFFGRFYGHRLDLLFHVTCCFSIVNRTYISIFAFSIPSWIFLLLKFHFGVHILYCIFDFGIIFVV